MADKYQRERAYRERSQRLVYRGMREPRAHTVRLSEVGHHEAHVEESSGLAFDGSGIVKVPKTKRQVPETFSVPSARFYAENLHKVLRKPRAEDLRRIERIEGRIATLQRDLRAAVDQAFENGLPINDTKLREAVTKRYADAKRGYPSNARVPKV